MCDESWRMSTLCYNLIHEWKGERPGLVWLRKFIDTVCQKIPRPRLCWLLVDGCPADIKLLGIRSRTSSCSEVASHPWNEHGSAAATWHGTIQFQVTATTKLLNSCKSRISSAWMTCLCSWPVCYGKQLALDLCSLARTPPTFSFSHIHTPSNQFDGKQILHFGF